MSTTRSIASVRPAPRAERGAARDSEGRRGSAGAGLIDTTVGFLIFLVLLLFSAQLIIRLYASSALSAAASHAAEEVAYAPDPPAEMPIAESEARRQLGSFGGPRTTFDWGPVGADYVVLTVTGHAPSLVPFDSGWATVTRTVTVRVERFR